MEAREIHRLKQKRKLLAKRMAKIEEFVRGSVVLMKRPCAYPRCRKCASGERHPTWVLTVSRCGKTHTVYLGKVADRIVCRIPRGGSYELRLER